MSTPYTRSHTIIYPMTCNTHPITHDNLTDIPLNQADVGIALLAGHANANTSDTPTSGATSSASSTTTPAITTGGSKSSLVSLLYSTLYHHINTHYSTLH